MTLLVEERQQQADRVRKGAGRGAPAGRSRLARQVDNLKDLVARLEQGLDSADPRRPRRRAPSDDQKAASKPALAALNDPGRHVAGHRFRLGARDVCRCPVNGVKIRDFGASDGIGGTERGISVATRPGAQVTAPCDGWVVYAGPFRSYGQLLILNAGGGYHVVLAGMERISVDIGQFVLTGEPVAVMGSGTAQVAAATIAHGDQPAGCFTSNFARTGLPSIPARGGPKKKVRRSADDAQDIPGSPRCGGRRGADPVRSAAAGHLRRHERQGGRFRRHLSPSQPVRRRVRARALRLCREAGRQQARRNRDQRHAGRARSAFELHGRQELPRHADPDPRRIRRARHRGHDGRRPREGGGADRRDARRQGRHAGQRHHHPSRRRARCRA